MNFLIDKGLNQTEKKEDKKSNKLFSFFFLTKKTIKAKTLLSIKF